jgi:hypothetical protein
LVYLLFFKFSNILFPTVIMAMRGNFAPRGHLAMSTNTFGSHKSKGGDNDTYWVETRDSREGSNSCFIQ